MLKVEVVWVDSCSYAEVWISKDLIKDIPLTPSKCTTVGYLVQEDDNRVTIAQSINDGEYGRLFTIPRGCITNLTELEYYDPFLDDLRGDL